MHSMIALTDERQGKSNRRENALPYRMRDNIVGLLNESTRVHSIDAKGTVTLARHNHVTALAENERDYRLLGK